MDIEKNLNNVLDRVNKAANRSGRNVDDIHIVAVTKNVDIKDILEAINLGIRNIGENRAQELREKYRLIKQPVNWHFIGRLQSNKVKYIVDKVALIHSLDRLSLAKELDKRGRKIDRIVPVLVQVNIAKEPTKGGVLEEEVFPFIEQISNLKNIKIKGFMTIAPHTSNEEKLRTCFSRLRELYESVNKKQYKNVDMQYLSMGMTNDFEIAIEEGSNMIRIGRALFGERI